MPGASLHADADFGAWASAFADAERRADDLSGLHGAIGEVLVNVIKHNFQTSGDGLWAPLAPATLLERAREAQGGGSITKRTKGGGKGLKAGAIRAIAQAQPLIKSAAGLYATIAAEATSDYAEAGSNLVYAAHQFFGSKPGWKWRIPARNPLYLHPADEAEILRMYTDYFMVPFS